MPRPDTPESSDGTDWHFLELPPNAEREMTALSHHHHASVDEKEDNSAVRTEDCSASTKNRTKGMFGDSVSKLLHLMDFL